MDTYMESPRATIILEDGMLFEGYSFGWHPPHVSELTSENAVCAELVFNTAMTGYVEILSDPSYYQQIVLLTTAHVGNYGVDIHWSQLFKTGTPDNIVTPSALIVHDLYRGVLAKDRIALHTFLKSNKRPLIANVDTRSITRHIRDNDAQQAMLVLGGIPEVTANKENVLHCIASSAHIEGSAIAREAGVSNKIRLAPQPTRHDIAAHNSIEKNTEQGITMGENNAYRGMSSTHTATADSKREHKKIVLLDCGVKQNIITAFSEFETIVLPSSASSAAILDESPDAVLVSNGPGDPASLKQCVQTLESLVGRLTLFGICFGHQLISLALGAKTYKLPFGHHGANHAVRDEITKQVYVVSENHGFAVDKSTLPPNVLPWFENTSDGTLEGIYSDSLKIYSVQFHPEAGPGPLDVGWIFSFFKNQL